MNILYLITTGDLGGAQKYVLELAEHFHGYIAVGAEGSSLPAKASKKNIAVLTVPHLVRRIQPLFDLLALWEVYQLIRKLQPDIVHVNSSKAGVIGSVAGWLAGKPVVFTAHGFQYLEPMHAAKRLFFKLCELYCRPLRKFVITVSDRDRTTALADKIITIDHSKTVHLGSTRPEFLSQEESRARLGMHQECVYIGCIANFYPVKNLRGLLHAFARVHTNFPTVRLALIGDGPDRNTLAQLTHTLSLTEQVEFLGQRDQAAIYMKAFNVFVLPSLKEGFPYTLLEALAAELPIVATQVGGVEEVLGPAGVLVPPNDPRALASALEHVLEQPNGAEALRSDTQKQYEKFSLQTMVEQTRYVYVSILKPRKANAASNIQDAHWLQ